MMMMLHQHRRSDGLSQLLRVVCKEAEAPPAPAASSAHGGAVPARQNVGKQQRQNCHTLFVKTL
jgi:hypothetical protein